LTEPRPSVEIKLDLCGPLTWLADADARAGQLLRAWLEKRLVAWMAEMSLPVEPRVVLGTDESDQGPRFLPIAVRIAGQRCPFSRTTVARVFEASTEQIPFGDSASVREVHAWLGKMLSGPGQAPGPGQVQALEMIVALAMEVATQCFPIAIGRDAAVAFLARSRAQLPDLAERAASLDPGFVESVLCKLLTFPIAFGEQRTILEWLLEGQAAGRPPERVAERLYDVLRPATIEIHLGRLAGESILPGMRPMPAGNVMPLEDVPGVKLDTLATLRDHLYFGLGLYLPRSVCVLSEELPERAFQFRMNDRRMPLRIALDPGQLFAESSAEQLQPLGIASRPLADPESGAPGTVISIADREKATAAGIILRSPLEHFLLALDGDLRAMAPRMLSVEDVEYRLVRLSQFFPALFESADQVRDAPAVASVLRHLLRQGISIRDARTIFDTLQNFRYTTGFQAPTAGWGGVEPYIYIGDLELHGEPYFTESEPYVACYDLSPFQLAVEPSSAWRHNGRLAAEFVKCSQKREMTHQYSRGQMTVICHVIDPDIERDLLTYLREGSQRSGTPPFDRNRVGAILGGIASKLAGDDRYPILVTSTPDVALLVEDLIARDFPETPIIHRQLFESSANIQPVGKVPGLQSATRK
jgi:flagellar biosynthesis component FlhA